MNTTFMMLLFGAEDMVVEGIFAKAHLTPNPKPL